MLRVGVCQPDKEARVNQLGLCLSTEVERANGTLGE